MIQLGLDPMEFARVQGMLATLPANARFGASIGLNRTANEIQDKIRETLPGHFTLRRESFIKNTIYRKPGEDFATKDKLEAGVRIREDRNVLAKFEAGGQKRPLEGKSIAVPLGARPTKTAIVPEKFRLATLFFNQQSLFSQAGGILGARTKAQRKRLLKRSVASDIFIKNGIVFQRAKSRRGKPTALWIFKPQTKLPPALHFVETAFRVARDRLAANVAGAIEVEVTRGLTSKNGPA